MSEPERIFCRGCGTRKISFDLDYFDEFTGHKKTELRCPNVSKCQVACGESDEGHSYKCKFLTSTYTCKRCGRVVYGGDYF